MKVRQPILATTVAALAAGCNQSPEPGGLPPAVDAFFAEYSATDGPGCSVGVIQDGRLIGSAGYGMANLDHGIPNDPSTVFRTASVSKQFTAGAIALLALRGDLDLDAPVRRYLPDFPDYPDPPTVRHLVHHTSGVRDYVGLMRLAGYRDEDFYTNAEVLAAINRQRALNFQPGAEYLYSNAGYFLLGQIVASVSGQSLREFAETHFFAPLGMTDTHFHDDHNEVVARRATGYSPADNGFRINVTTLDMVGDGGLFTSVEDWVAWDRNLETGTVGGPDWVALMHQRGVLNSGDTIPYAFGISHGEHRGLATVGHGGAWVGYRTGMTRYPETGYSFVALCNRYAGSFYSPELDATYHILLAGADGLTLRAGKWDPVTLSQSDEGVLHGEGLNLRFSDLAEGRFRSIMPDAGRVKNLRFTRVGSGGLVVRQGSQR